MIRERLLQVREQIGEAARRAGRRPEEITLVAVSKVKPAEDIRAAYEAGQRDFGESYVQEFQGKRDRLGTLPGAVFHLIGRLQSNKAKQAARLFDVIQSLDSLKLARRLDREGRKLDVFIQIRLSAEETKHGLEAKDLPELKEFVEGCDNLRLRGLMGMPPWFDDGEQSRPYFCRLRRLAEEHGLKEISMGMSHDFAVAIEEGATMVRVGTSIFGKRIYAK